MGVNRTTLCQRTLTLLTEVLSPLDKLLAAMQLPEETEQELSCALPAPLAPHWVHGTAAEHALHTDDCCLCTNTRVSQPMVT